MIYNSYHELLKHISRSPYQHNGKIYVEISYVYISEWEHDIYAAMPQPLMHYTVNCCKGMIHGVWYCVFSNRCISMSCHMLQLGQEASKEASELM